MASEVRKEVKTFITKMMCDCGGEMLPHGNTSVDIHPPMYLHVCNVCSKVELYFQQYPCLNYTEIVIDSDTESE